MFSTRNFNRSKPILFILILFPSLLWAYQFVTGNLGVNPIEKLMDELGLMALRLIIITLMITSLSNIKTLKSIVVLRRMIGLFAFYYVCLHFSTYIVLDHYLDMQFIIQDIIKRPFITFGFISFLFLIPLASTSTNNMIKRLGFKLWKKIHYLIYPVAILASMHFYVLVRADKTEPVIYMGIIILLLLHRIFKKLARPQLAQ
ncbi:sulfoxide reductase heme-binding subunit YedZ [Pelagibacteraceae bacterium]|nr:sulfoxide reductase heme-binding subunit YedZ [Pelagibacteraceae bacterium]MDC3156507.1 sulfoxide reductase heme-binding subunit YedZ [Pelagibacteraceae bacterium]